MLVEAFVHAAAHATLARLFADRPSIVPDLLVREGRLSPAALPLLERLLLSLAEIGAAEATPDGWRLAPDAGFPPPPEIWRSALVQAPDVVSELAAAARAAADLEHVLRAGLPGQPASPAILEHLRASAPLVAAPAVAEAVRAIGALLAAWPKERPLRVLEVAGGGGALLRAVQPVAEAAAVHLAWTFTDRDPAAVQAAARRLGARPGWRFATFDPATATADALAGPFDLVVGTGLAALSEVGPEALSALAARLAEGGAALFAVPAPSRLVDFVFGRDPAWWAGPAERLAGGAAFWHQVLPRAGLAEVSVLAAMDGPAPGGVLLAFGRRLEPRQPAAQARPVLLLADPETPAAALASRLAADLPRAGRRVALCAPGADWTVEAGSEVVLLPETSDAGDPAAIATARTALALQAARRAQAAQARLWLVTRGAVQPQESEGHNPAEAALWGFGRVVRNEVPALDVRLVDLAPRLGPSAQARAMAQELATPDDEMEVVRTDQGRRVLRLVREETAANPDADGDNRVLAAARPGVLETLTWTSRARRRPGRGEVEI
ncbi:MAG: methyltransferase domain-containing protein, partial [Elioraea sp.]|nr:methyltransferase domain-containing protein [Elioraea sp.]